MRGVRFELKVIKWVLLSPLILILAICYAIYIPIAFLVDPLNFRPPWFHKYVKRLK